MGPVQPCPLQEKWWALEVLVSGEDGGPVRDVLVEIGPGGGEALSDRTDSNGVVRFEGLALQPHTVLFPELDRDAWESTGDEALEPDRAEVAGKASWGTPNAPAPAPPPHRIADGDCISSVAFRYGFFPETVWSDPANAELLELRKTKNILLEGDLVHIPAKRARPLTATPKRRYRIRRKGVPEILRIRFVDGEGRPRKAVPYLLTISTMSGEPVAARKGDSDGDGWVKEPIPPDAAEGEILFGVGPGQLRMPFTLGRVAPVDTPKGVYSRLRNLGYRCGEWDGGMSEDLKFAVEGFQARQGLEPTGEVDAATRRKLVEAHRS